MDVYKLLLEKALQHNDTYVHTFMTLTWNLQARSDNIDRLHLRNVSYSGKFHR